MCKRDIHEVTPLILGRVPVKFAHCTGLNSHLRGRSGERDWEGVGVDELDRAAGQSGCLHLRHREDVRARNGTLGAHGSITVRAGSS